MGRTRMTMLVLYAALLALACLSLAVGHTLIYFTIARRNLNVSLTVVALLVALNISCAAVRFHGDLPLATVYVLLPITLPDSVIGGLVRGFWIGLGVSSAICVVALLLTRNKRLAVRLSIALLAAPVAVGSATLIENKLQPTRFKTAAAIAGVEIIWVRSLWDSLAIAAYGSLPSNLHGVACKGAEGYYWSYGKNWVPEPKDEDWKFAKDMERACSPSRS